MKTEAQIKRVVETFHKLHAIHTIDSQDSAREAMAVISALEWVLNEENERTATLQINFELMELGLLDR